MGFDFGAEVGVADSVGHDEINASTEVGFEIFFESSWLPTSVQLETSTLAFYPVIQLCLLSLGKIRGHLRGKVEDVVLLFQGVEPVDSCAV